MTMWNKNGFTASLKETKQTLETVTKATGSKDKQVRFSALLALLCYLRLTPVPSTRLSSLNISGSMEIRRKGQLARDLIPASRLAEHGMKLWIADTNAFNARANRALGKRSAAEMSV